MAGDDELKRALRDAAGAHLPDRARILARVGRGMAHPGAAPAALGRGFASGRLWGSAPWPRVVLATAAVAAVVGVGGYTAAALLRDGAAPGPAVVAASPSGGETTGAAEALRTPRTCPAGTAVELRVAQNGGVADTGDWRSLPAEDFTTEVREEGGALVCTGTLRPDRTVPAGQHVFAGQYNHAEGDRDAPAYRFTVRATSEDGRQAAVGGGF